MFFLGVKSHHDFPFSGAPRLIGYDHRPVFTYPRYTMHMLEHYIVPKLRTPAGEMTSSPDIKLVETQLMLRDNEYDQGD